jgi:hypothetical protein
MVRGTSASRGNVGDANGLAALVMGGFVMRQGSRWALWSWPLCTNTGRRWTHQHEAPSRRTPRCVDNQVEHTDYDIGEPQREPVITEANRTHIRQSPPRRTPQ